MEIKGDGLNDPADSVEAEVVATVRELLTRLEKPTGEIELTTSLYGDGLDLDSLEVAELSAALEDRLGGDPFRGAENPPETIGDLVAYFGSSPL